MRLQLKNISSLPQPCSFNAGHYQVRLASSFGEVEAAQALRYRVFYQERGGKPTAKTLKLEREVDEWDKIAYHIIVLDQNKDNTVVGTLRLVSNKQLLTNQYFYTEKTFDLSGLRKNYQRILELSRYCIDPSGRSGVILMLIWKFAMKFIIDNKFQLMLGCASFPGTDTAAHGDILTWLYDHNLAPESLRPKPVTATIPIQTLRHALNKADYREAQHKIPTLLRGYLKLGAKIGDSVVVDLHFNTVFVPIYVDAAEMLRDNHALVPK